jgi:serine/threonine-protein kinase
MEQLDGLDLDQLLLERGPLGSAEAVGYVVQACNAIAEAHTHGIIHRDIKPSNLFLARLGDGSTIIKVLDFGVSKIRDAPVSGLTRPGEYCGSPLYMAPEQAVSARSVDARADIWSIGIVLYELLSGHNPVDRGNLIETFGMLIKGKIPALDEQVELPAGLGAVVHRCLERDPGARYPTVAHLAMDLASFARR